MGIAIFVNITFVCVGIAFAMRSGTSQRRPLAVAAASDRRILLIKKPAAPYGLCPPLQHQISLTYYDVAYRTSQPPAITAAQLCRRLAPQSLASDDPIARACGELGRDPHNAEALNDLGVSLARRQKYGDAIIAYRLALAANSGLPQVETNLGIAYFRAGDFHAAITPFRRAVALDPANLQARTLLGMSFYGTQDYNQAASELAKVAAAQPGNTKLLFVLAECYLWSHQSQKTLQVFQQIENTQPDSAAAYMLLGQALDALGRYTQAIEEFQKAAAAAPNAPNVHFVLGYLYWKQRRFDEAGKEFQKELAANPGNAEARAYLGDIRYRRGDLSAGHQLLAKAFAEGAHIRLVYLDLGIIDTRLEKYHAAIDELREAVALDPTQTDAHYRLALAYKGAGNAAAADRELQTIKEMEEENRAVTQRSVMKPSSVH